MSNKNLNQALRFMLILFFALAGVIPGNNVQATGTGTISGILYKAGATPITGIAVQVRAVLKSDGSQEAATTSNIADGSYILNVPLDKELLLVASDENPDVDGYGTAYYNQAKLRANATPFNLSAGTPSYTGVNLTLPVSHPAPYIEQLTFNVRTGKVLNNKIIRRAIAYGTNRERILNQAFLGNIGNYGVVLNSLIEPGYWSQPAYNQVTIYPYDPTQAKAILDAAGITDHNSNGIRDIGDVDIALDFQTTNSPQRINSSAIFVENMTAIGIKVNVTILDLTPEEFTGPTGPLQAGTFDVAQFTWGETTWGTSNISDLNMDDAYPLAIYQTGDPLNFGGYTNSTAETEFTAAMTATTRAAMSPHVLAYYQQIADDPPSLPLFTRETAGRVGTSSGKNVLANLSDRGFSVLYQNATSGGYSGGYHNTKVPTIHPNDLPLTTNKWSAMYEIGSNVTMLDGTGATVCVNYGTTLTPAQENIVQLYNLSMSGARAWTNIFISRNTTTNTICGFTKNFNTFAALVPKYNVPASFIKKTPANLAINQPIKTTFSWNASTFATRYELCYDTINNNLCDSQWINIGNNIYTVMALPKYGTTYYWEVRASNNYGYYTYANNSVWQSFKTTFTPVKKTFSSIGLQDGWILESAENSSKGGSINSAAATFNLGDNAANKQYRAILHFNTSTLPDNAIIISATLKINKQGLVGTNPFVVLGGLSVDIRKPFFGTTPSLVASDFQAAPTKPAAATFGAPAGTWYGAVLNPTGKLAINTKGPTQFRLLFKKDDNNDHKANYMMFYSGNTATAANRPQLIIVYYVP